MLKYLVSLLCFSAAAQAFNVAETTAQARQSFWPKRRQSGSEFILR